VCKKELGGVENRCPSSLFPRRNSEYPKVKKGVQRGGMLAISSHDLSGSGPRPFRYGMSAVEII
jgi:hypothetical protein